MEEARLLLVFFLIKLLLDFLVKLSQIQGFLMMDRLIQEHTRFFDYLFSKVELMSSTNLKLVDFYSCYFIQ